MGWSPAEIREVLGIEVAVLADDPLVAVYGGTVWEPWSSEIAADRFLAELHRLLALREQVPT